MDWTFILALAVGAMFVAAVGHTIGYENGRNAAELAHKRYVDAKIAEANELVRYYRDGAYFKEAAQHRARVALETAVSDLERDIAEAITQRGAEGNPSRVLRQHWPVGAKGCAACHGSGGKVKAPCGRCKGTGYVAG